MIDNRYAYNYSNIQYKYELTDIGDSTVPTYSQYEPFIPDQSKSYEENVILNCDRYSEESKQKAPGTTIDELITSLESNVDYILLLNDSTEE